jgi:hypothetical protein
MLAQYSEKSLFFKMTIMRFMRKDGNMNSISLLNTIYKYFYHNSLFPLLLGKKKKTYKKTTSQNEHEQKNNNKLYFETGVHCK